MTIQDVQDEAREHHIPITGQRFWAWVGQHYRCIGFDQYVPVKEGNE